jgi:predicted Rossmann-fold nucleotide-binding protein
MMGALADAVLANGGEVTGVIPKMFETPELLHTGLTELIVVGDINTRKARMDRRSGSSCPVNTHGSV